MTSHSNRGAIRISGRNIKEGTHSLSNELVSASMNFCN